MQIIAYGNLKQLILKQVREKVNRRCVTAFKHFSHGLNYSLAYKSSLRYLKTYQIQLLATLAVSSYCQFFVSFNTSRLAANKKSIWACV